MSLISTIDGPIPEEELEIKLIETNQPNSLEVAREYRRKSDGKLVRRDAWVAFKSGIGSEATGNLGD